MYRRPIQLLFCLFLCTNISCKNDAPVSELVHKKEVISDLNQRPSDKYEYLLQWGDIILPLEKYANPNGFRGETEVELEEMLRVLDQQILLLKNDVPLDIEFHTLYNYTDGWRDSKWHPNPADDQRNLNQEVLEEMSQSIQKGDRVVIHLSATNKDVYVAGATIHIKDPYKAYEAEKRVKWNRANEQPFGFQVISQEGKESVLRIDTTAEATTKVYNLYKDRKDYKILHIPNFETQRRLVIDEDEIFSKYDIRRTELFNNEFDRWTLSEFTDYYRRWVYLKWGTMEARGNSDNYPLATFLSNIDKELRLEIDKREIPILGFDLLIKAGERPPIRFITNGLAVDEIKKSLMNIPSRSTVYFTNLIIDDDGATKHFPLNFAFNIDDPLAFDLDITEVEADNKIGTYASQFSDSLHQISYNNYRLSDVVAHLIGLNSTKIFFNQFEQDPIVNICFASPNLPEEYGKKAIQEALSKQYNIDFYWSWYNFYQLTAPVPELLAGYRHQDDPDNIRQFSYDLDNETKIAELHYTNLYQMAARIGGEFRIAIVNSTGIEGFHEMNLDVSSLENLKIQLMDEYGLELTKMPDNIETVAYQYKREK